MTNTTKDLRHQTSPEVRDMRGMIRRVAITLTSGAFWQVVGHLLFDGKEIKQAENFSGIGFYSRPKAGANAEAIVIHPGAAAPNGVIIATRDEDLRKQLGEIEQNSSAMATYESVVIIRADGTIEIRSQLGTPHPLPTLSEFNNHTHPAPGGATSVPTTAAVGTSVLKAQ